MGCGKFQKDCKVHLAQKSQGSKCDLLYIEDCMVEGFKDTWVINSRSINNICVSLRGLRETRSFFSRASRYKRAWNFSVG